MTGLKDINYTPDAGPQATYERLYQLYRVLHDSFGGVNQSSDLSQVMKELLKIKQEA